MPPEAKPRAIGWLGVGSSVTVAVVLAACTTNPPPPYPGLPRLTIDIGFSVDNLCNSGVSPEIRLGGVPDKTASYAVQALATEVLFQKPWRDTVPATRKDGIPEGASKNYIGPCIGDLERWTNLKGDYFRVEVLALNAAGQPLAYGQTQTIVRSLALTARQEQILGRPTNSIFDERPTYAPYPTTPGPFINSAPSYTNQGVGSSVPGLYP